jgi:ATP phosphoribosyltransferase regulatory subunit
VITLEPAVPEDVLAAIRAPFLALGGAELIDTPVLQPLALLLDLAGEAMRARLFVVQADGIDEACLRPDFTIPVASAHIVAGRAAGRYLYEGKAFQVAPPGSGRAEEFVQVGLEVLGPSGDAGGPRSADAEALVLAWRSARAGGRDDLKVRLGDAGLFARFIDALGLAPAMAARLKRAFLRPGRMAAELQRAQSGEPAPRDGDRLARLIAALPESQAAQALEELWALAGIEPVGGRSAGEIVHRLAERAQVRAAPRLTGLEADLIMRFLAVAGPPPRALQAAAAVAKEAWAELDGVWEEWADRLARLAEAGVPQEALTLETGFGRAFGYYDGFLFEVTSAALGPEQAVAAGGRYDGLLGRLGGGGSAVGCMVRPARAWAAAGRPQSASPQLRSIGR